jgi:cell division protein FtsW
MLPHLIVAGTMGLLVLLQPDLGHAAIFFAVTLLMLIVAGTRLNYVIAVVLGLLPILYYLIAGTPWRLRRMLAYLDPWAYRHDAGYQMAESLISIVNGGVWGQGLGNGKQKLFFLPAAHTDFLFAIIGEEIGFVGMTVVLLLFGLLLYRGMKIALSAVDLFGFYLALGICLTLGLQALLHVGVVLGVMPTKGIGFPLLSYGGSGLVIQLFALGILMRIGRCDYAVPDAAPVRKSSANRRSLPRVVVVNR